ncbi:hypothetical protein P5673_016219 [Acropora cervicornis]|uniref:Uncharacterized protein n=1 Tax=Acropora cervicornis TaxID=6130 RepID=A0AAD9QHK3_ACRCE|nr:hypothetical protein P5673_016219 [Acropora cervicornis]
MKKSNRGDPWVVRRERRKERGNHWQKFLVKFLQSRFYLICGDFLHLLQLSNHETPRIFAPVMVTLAPVVEAIQHRMHLSVVNCYQQLSSRRDIAFSSSFRFVHIVLDRNQSNCFYFVIVTQHFNARPKTIECSQISSTFTDKQPEFFNTTFFFKDYL